MCRRAGSAFTASHTSYPLRRGMTTSARITSGLSSRALAIASSPLSTEVTLKSSLANVMPTTFWIVIESSARRRVLGMEGSCPPERGRGIISSNAPIA